MHIVSLWLPLWAVFGLLAALLSATMMLLQERLKVDGFALAYWNKIACVLATLPIVLVKGLPHQPLFYVFLGIGAFMYTVNDVVFFRAIPRVGAGIVARLLPGAMILSFLLWFVVKPSLFLHYMHSPYVSVAIFAVLCSSAWFAGHIKKCTVSMQAVRTIWFVIFAATVGPLLSKTVTTYADIRQGPSAYIFSEALMMLTIWSIYFIVRRPIPWRVMVSRHTCFGGLAIGLVSAGMVAANVYAYYNVDNPAYIPAVKYLDSIIILVVYGLTGRPVKGNVWAGIGVVACAAALVVLKAQI